MILNSNMGRVLSKVTEAKLNLLFYYILLMHMGQLILPTTEILLLIFFHQLMGARAVFWSLTSESFLILILIEVM